MKDDRETFLAEVGRITQLTTRTHPAVLGSVNGPQKFRTADQKAQDTAQLRERRRKAVCDWFESEGVYLQHDMNIEKLLDQLDAIK